MIDINKTRDFYDTHVQQRGLWEKHCGSEFLPVYLHSPYLFVANYLQNKIKSHGQGLQLLDLCCGAGIHSVKYAQMGFFVKGIDISSVSIEKAKQLAEKYNIVGKLNFAVQEVTTTLNFPNESFDVVFVSGSLYYLNFEKIIPEILRVLKKGGNFVCIETNGNNFVMNGVRRVKNIFLQHRDKQTMKGLLKSKDIKKILSFFPSTILRYFDFFTITGSIFLWNKWLNLATIVDDFFLNKIGFRIFGFKFVIIGEK